MDRCAGWGVAAIVLLHASVVLAAPGDLDPTFGVGGRVTTNFRDDVTPSQARAVVIQPDGKIIAGGGDYWLVRYLADGSLDPTFGNGGRAAEPIQGELYALALQADGKIVAVGGTVSGDSNFAVIRFNANGTVDTTFDEDGRQTVDIGLSNDEAMAVAVQPDGKIVLAGYSFNGVDDDFALMRFLPNGWLDSALDGDGILTTPIGAGNERAQAVVVSGGKILVAGFASNGSNDDFAVVRYNLNGTLDSSFDLDGKAVRDINGGNDVARALAVQSDGKILLAGSARVGSTDDFALVRYDSSGAIDPTFDGDGQVTTAIGSGNDEAMGMALRADGSIVVVGYAAVGSTEDFAVARYDSAGTLDPSFDGDGKRTAAIGSTDDQALSMALASDGKIIAAGYSRTGSDTTTDVFAIARFATDGTLDSSFDLDGKVTTAVGGSADEIKAITTHSDGRVLVAGPLRGSVTSFGTVRYNTDGSLDTSFGSGGKVITAIGTDATPWDITVQPDGKIIVAGAANVTAGSSLKFALVRYNTDGSLDTSFDGDGISTISFTGDNYILGMLLQPDGRIVVAGLRAGRFAVARFTTSGALDSTFGVGGIAASAFPTAGGYAMDLALQPDGKIVAGGRAGNDFALARYNANGTLDTSFDGDGAARTVMGPAALVNSIALQPDGKIVAAGLADEGFALARYLPNGSLDPSFDGDGRVILEPWSGNFKDVAVLPDGKILGIGLQWEFVLKQFTDTGSLDTSFGDGGTVETRFFDFGSAANAATLLSNGRLYAAGHAVHGSNLDFAVARYIATECGDGDLDAGEQCDLSGGVNGSTASCCTTACTFAAGGTVCRVGSGDVCDPSEMCTGAASACPGNTVTSTEFPCRPAAGTCDVAEYCPGVAGQACPSNTFVAAGVVCRSGSGDLCDQNETCTGSNVACPADDAPSRAGVQCRSGSGDLCDPAEACTGVPGQVCPADMRAAAGTLCRGAAGICDVAEACTGLSMQSCPADALASSSVVCRHGSGDLCDTDETCTGSGVTCPADDVAGKAGVVCRAGSGDLCDAAESCTGTPGQPCPADVHAAAGTVCRASAGVCDVEEVCSGSPGQACATDSFAATTVVCRHGSGDVCDADETCSGSGAACPADDAPGRAGVVCRAGSGDVCDADESCTGTSGQPCPADVRAAAGTVCRMSAGVCDLSESCSGNAGVPCPSDAFALDGTNCEDGAFCNGVESCQSGVCSPDSTHPCEGGCDEAKDVCLSCPTAPRDDCRTAARDTLLVRRGASEKGYKLVWRWLRGASTDHAELADPSVDATYSLCIYEGASNAVATQLVVPPDASHWKALGARRDRGFKYRDKTRSVDGVDSLLLRPHSDDRSRIVFVAKGAMIPNASLPLDLPVKVQLYNSDTGICWSSEITSATANDSTIFRGLQVR